MTWVAQVRQAAEVGKKHFRAAEGRGGEGRAGQRKGQQGREGQGRPGVNAIPWEVVLGCCSSPAQGLSVPAASVPVPFQAMEEVWGLAASVGNWQSTGQGAQSLVRTAKGEAGLCASGFGSVLETHLLLLLPQSWQR